jgi:general L-amino acid transport system permease protein
VSGPPTIPAERIGPPLGDEPPVELAPQRPPIGPGEWVRRNLFSSWFNGVLTVAVAALLAFVSFRLVRFVFLTADWTIVKTYLRTYMIGRFPIEEAWRVWIGLYAMLALVGLSRGVLPPVRWTRGRLLFAVGVSVLVVGALLYLIESALVWMLLVAGAGILAAGFVIGRRAGRRLRRPLVIGWVLVFPLLVVLLSAGSVQVDHWGGLLLNVMVAAVVIPLSFPIGILLALGRRSSLPVVSWFCVGVIEVIRGVPLLTLLIFGRFVLILLMPPQFSLGQLLRASLMFTLFSSAYVAEIVRGGLQGIPEGQYEASRALGLSTTRTMQLIALPQALRATIPPMIGHFISVFKDTSLLAALGIFSDLLATARRASQDLRFTGLQAEALLPAAVIFWVIAFAMSRWSQRLEVRLGVGMR